MIWKTDSTLLIYAKRHIRVKAYKNRVSCRGVSTVAPRGGRQQRNDRQLPLSADGIQGDVHARPNGCVPGGLHGDRIVGDRSVTMCGFPHGLTLAQHLSYGGNRSVATPLSLEHAMNSSSSADLHQLLVSRAYEPIALTQTKGGHFAVNGAIDEYPIVFLVDTGASNTVIDRKTAAALNLETNFVDNRGGGLGAASARTERAPVRSVTLGGFRTGLDSVFIMDLDTVNRALVDNGGDPIDGVVGADVLLQGGAIIDYARGMLYLQQANEPGDPQR